MYSALADIWSGEITERRETTRSGGATAVAVEVVHPHKGLSYGASGIMSKFSEGFAVGRLTVKFPAKAFSDATLFMVMDCLSA